MLQTSEAKAVTLLQKKAAPVSPSSFQSQDGVTSSPQPKCSNWTDLGKTLQPGTSGVFSPRSSIGTAQPKPPASRGCCGGRGEHMAKHL